MTRPFLPDHKLQFSVKVVLKVGKIPTCGGLTFLMNFSLCEKSDADHWIYAGEGNLNLVVRYTGDNQIYVSLSLFDFI